MNVLPVIRWLNTSGNVNTVRIEKNWDVSLIMSCCEEAAMLTESLCPCVCRVNLVFMSLCLSCKFHFSDLLKLGAYHLAPFPGTLFDQFSMTV